MGCKSRAIITVIGRDKTGIISAVTTELSQLSVNIEDISQTIMQDYFAMIMLADISSVGSIKTVAETMSVLGNKIGVTINVQHEDIFNTMHRI